MFTEMLLAAPDLASIENLAGAAIGAGLKFVWDRIQENKKWKAVRKEAAEILKDPLLTNDTTVALAQALLEKLLPQLADEAQKVREAFNKGPIVPTVNYAGTKGIDFDIDEDPTPEGGKPPASGATKHLKVGRRARAKQPTFDVQFNTMVSDKPAEKK